MTHRGPFAQSHRMDASDRYNRQTEKRKTGKTDVSVCPFRWSLTQSVKWRTLRRHRTFIARPSFSIALLKYRGEISTTTRNRIAACASAALCNLYKYIYRFSRHGKSKHCTKRVNEAFKSQQPSYHSRKHIEPAADFVP